MPSVRLCSSTMTAGFRLYLLPVVVGCDTSRLNCWGPFQTHLGGTQVHLGTSKAAENVHVDPSGEM